MFWLARDGQDTVSVKIFGVNYELKLIYKRVKTPKLNLKEKEIEISLPSKYKKIDIENFKSVIDNCLTLDNLGLFCYNDEHAYMIIEELKKHNFDLNKIEIIGYDAISQNTFGTTEIASIGFDYELIAKTASYCATTNSKNREKIKMCFDVKAYKKGEKNEDI